MAEPGRSPVSATMHCMFCNTELLIDIDSEIFCDSCGQRFNIKLNSTFSGDHSYFVDSPERAAQLLSSYASVNYSLQQQLHELRSCTETELAELRRKLVVSRQEN